MKLDNIRNPSLYEVKQLTRDWGLVGEEDTALTVFLSFFGGGFVLMSGLSSGGKNAIVNAAAFCTPGASRDEPTDDSEWVAKVPTSLSKTVLYQQHEKFNTSPVHVHMDISSISDKPFLEDIWKAHGEGRSITHSWTQMMGQEREERSQTLHPPNCMVLFLAEDNQQVDMNDYPEVRNRALVLPVDDSAELTEKVNERQAKIEAGMIDLKLDTERAKEVRQYVASIPQHMFGKDGRGGYLNPVAPAIDNQNPLPQHFTEARRDFPRLLDFMKSVALFHFDERMQEPKKDLNPPGQDNMVTLLVTPEDAWYAMRIFGEKMILSALNLREKDFELLNVLRENMGETYTVDELMMGMRDRGYNITSSDVRSSMENMLYKGYVRKGQDSNRVEYSASPFAAQVSRNVELDWPTVIEDTREVAQEALPGSVADEYIDHYLEGDGLLVTHPFTGETINLAEQEANELEQEVEAREAEEEDSAFDSDPYSDGEDDSEEGGGRADPKQGTLTR
jgi:hypothetical protein